MTASPLAVVPPRRLGVLLRQSRESSCRSLSDLAGASGFGSADLEAIEKGDRAPTEAELTGLLGLYGVAVEELVPERTQLVIDLRDHRVEVGREARTLAGPTPTADEVLAAYLSLVYALRKPRPGTPLTLRDGDLDVLARALRLAVPDVERRLHGLMVEPSGELDRRVGVLRRRLLLPAIGVAVALTAIGLVVLVRDSADDPTPVPIEAPTTAAPAPSPEVPVRVDTSPGGAGAPQVATHNEDGSVSQVDRQPDPNAPPPPASTTTSAS